MILYVHLTEPLTAVDPVNLAPNPALKRRQRHLRHMTVLRISKQKDFFAIGHIFLIQFK